MQFFCIFYKCNVILVRFTKCKGFTYMQKPVSWIMRRVQKTNKNVKLRVKLQNI